MALYCTLLLCIVLYCFVLNFSYPFCSILIFSLLATIIIKCELQCESNIRPDCFLLFFCVVSVCVLWLHLPQKCFTAFTVIVSFTDTVQCCALLCLRAQTCHHSPVIFLCQGFEFVGTGLYVELLYNIFVINAE